VKLSETYSNLGDYLNYKIQYAIFIYCYSRLKLVCTADIEKLAGLTLIG